MRLSCGLGRESAMAQVPQGTVVGRGPIVDFDWQSLCLLPADNDGAGDVLDDLCRSRSEE